MSRTGKKLGAGCAVLFCLPFAAIGAGAAGWIVWDVYRVVDMGSWDTVPGQILSADLESRSGSEGGSTQVAVATYSYVVGGQHFKGSRVSLDGSSDNLGSYQARTYQQLSEHLSSGEPITVHVDPRNPASSILFPRLRWEMLGFKLLFALVFGGVGFGLLIAAFRSGKRKRAQAVEQEHSPDKPWLWKPDWAVGRIRCSRRGVMAGAWLIAIFWNAISAPLLWAIPSELAKGNRAILIGAIFPVVGIGLLSWAIYEVLHWRKYRESVFELASVPGVIGGRLQGLVTVARPLAPADGFKLRLLCQERVEHRTSDGKSIRTNTLWEETQTLSHAFESGDSTVTILPISFVIPFDSQPSNATDSSTGIVWRLEVSAAVPGVDYRAQFEVPIFHTEASSETPPADVDIAANYRTALPPEALMAGTGIRVSERIGGGVEVYYPPARNLASSITITVFTAFWIGVVLVMGKVGAPLFFTGIFGFFGLLMILATLSSWLSSALIEVNSGGVTITRRFLGLGSPVLIPAHEIESIDTKQGMEANTVSYFDVKVQSKGAHRRHLDQGQAGRRRDRAPHARSPGESVTPPIFTDRLPSRVPCHPNNCIALLCHLPAFASVSEPQDPRLSGAIQHTRAWQTDGCC